MKKQADYMRFALFHRSLLFEIFYEKNGEYMVKNRIKSMENDTFMKNR